MRMTDMTDREKSVLLAKAAGWETDDDALKIHLPNPLWRESGYRQNVIRSLYDPANMALAWRCHLWALHVKRPFARDYLDYFWSISGEEHAQRLWLDKILELIEVNDA